MQKTPRATAKEVAKQLGMTVRRVHQLVDELILPEPDNEKRFDLTLCDLRYMLFKHGTEGQWSDFIDDIEAEATEVEEKVRRAMADDPADEQITAAIKAHLQYYSNLLFLATCRAKTKLERNLLVDKWTSDRDDWMGNLLRQFLRNKTWISDDGSRVIYRGPEVRAA
jgi:predicted transcriptional regulator